MVFPDIVFKGCQVTDGSNIKMWQTIDKHAGFFFEANNEGIYRVRREIPIMGKVVLRKFSNEWKACSYWGRIRSL